MRVLLDHCVPRPLRRHLVANAVSTAEEMGWSKLKNGELLEIAEKSGFEVLVTSDKNLRYQQNLSKRRIAIIELPTNRLKTLLNKHVTQLNTLIASIKAGGFEVIDPA